MHKLHSPIQARLKNTYLLGDMDMRREAAKKIEEQEALIDKLAERNRTLEHQLSIREGERTSDSWLEKFTKGRAS